MPTKILIVIPVPSSYLSGLLRATKYLNIQTMVFNVRGYTLLEKIIRGIFRNSNLATKLLNRRLIKTAKNFSPEILLAMKAELIDGEALKQISGLGIVTVNWFPDDVQALELAKKIANDYNYFFHFDPYAIRLLKKTNPRAKIEYLPFSANIIPGDQMILPTNYHHEISFIGNYYPIREKYLKGITGLDLNIWGDERWAKSSLSKFYRGKLPNSEFNEVCHASKININIQYESSCEGLVLRVFEVLGAGAFLLTDNKREAQKLFKLDSDLVMFKDEKDLRKKVLYYLVNNKIRDRIARKGYLTVRNNHTYIHRLRQIFKVIE